MFPLNVPSLLLTVLCALLAETEQTIPAPAHFYPYGPGEGDSVVPVSTPSSSGKSVVQLSQSFPCFSRVRNKMNIYTNGYTSVQPGSGYIDVFFLFGGIDTSKNDGRVYYRQTTDSGILQRATRDVRRYFSGASTFSANWVLIASYHRVTYDSGSFTSPVATFQVVHITNGVQSYIMYNYGDVQFAGDPASSGYAQLALDINYHLPDSRKPSAVDVELTTNVGVLGRWIFRVDGNTVVPGRIFNQDVYDCDNNSPCTAANRALGKYYFAYIDMSKFVQCGAWGQCWIRPCAPGTVFKTSISVCVHASQS